MRHRDSRYPTRTTPRDGDTYVTKVRYERRRERVGNSLQGLFFGPVVIFLGCLLLWNNEGWAIKTHRSLNEALEAYVSITSADEAFNEQHRGRLVHLTHQLSVDEAVTDPVFGLTRNDVISLNRDVEIYQWVESIKKEKKKQGRDTIVREIANYKKKWVKNPIDSQHFRRHTGRHENCCGALPVESESFRASHVNMGGYVLSNDITRKLTKTTGISASEVQSLPSGAERAGTAVYLPQYGSSSSGEQSALPSGGGHDLIEATTARVDGEEKPMFLVKATGEQFSTLEKALAAATLQETTVTIDGEDKRMFLVESTGETFSTREQALAATHDAAAPVQQNANSQRQLNSEAEIGDVRITFSEVPCAVVSVLAKLSESGNILTNWPSQQGSGYDVGHLSYGVISAEDMIANAQTENKGKTWMFRIGGLVLTYLGFSLITNIISTASDITLNWIPLLGPMANSVINLGVTIANVVLGSCISMLVASIAWVVYRPVLGVSLLVGSLGLFFTASQMGKQRGSRGFTSERVHEH